MSAEDHSIGGHSGLSTLVKALELQVKAKLRVLGLLGERGNSSKSFVICPIQLLSNNPNMPGDTNNPNIPHDLCEGTRKHLVPVHLPELSFAPAKDPDLLSPYSGILRPHLT